MLDVVRGIAAQKRPFRLSVDSSSAFSSSSVRLSQIKRSWRMQTSRFMVNSCLEMSRLIHLDPLRWVLCVAKRPGVEHHG